MDAGVTCVLTGEREVAGPLAAGCRFAESFAFGECLLLRLAALVLFGLAFGEALLFGLAFGEALLFGLAFGEALLFGFAFCGALLFGFVFRGALLFGFVFAEALLVGLAVAWRFGFLGLPCFVDVKAFPSPRGASGRAAVAGFWVVRGALAFEGRFTMILALAAAARLARTGTSCAPRVV